MTSKEDEANRHIVKSPGMPKYYYWGKNFRLAYTPDTWSSTSKHSAEEFGFGGFRNEQQKKLYKLMTVFRLCKLAAIGVFAYLVYLVYH